MAQVDYLDADASRPVYSARLSATGLRMVRALAPFWGFKRAIDIIVSVVCLPVVCILAAVIWVLNHRLNKGPLIYKQVRMGRNCEPFTMLKFRTMLPVEAVTRGLHDPVEADRITPFGHFLRRTRLDETPQLVNVLLGQMSLVGPRPDMWEHGSAFVTMVPGYRKRHAVRPGITGYAQIMSGYAEGVSATRKKVSYDLLYIRRKCWKLEMVILSRTVGVMISGSGAR